MSNELSKTFTWYAFSASQKGHYHQTNEDSVLLADNVGFWSIADGMGGHDEGQLASCTLVTNLKQLDRRQYFPLNVVQINQCIQFTNQQLQTNSLKLSSNAVMGTTLALLLFDNQKIHCIWAGDSRIYRLRDKKLEQLTYDHTQLNDLQRAGLIQPTQIPQHSSANKVTRAIGIAPSVDLEHVTEELQHRDIFILCSDGLTRAIDNSNIESLITNESIDDMPKKLITAVSEKGLEDDTSVISVIFEEN